MNPIKTTIAAITASIDAPAKEMAKLGFIRYVEGAPTKHRRKKAFVFAANDPNPGVWVLPPPTRMLWCTAMTNS